MSERISTPGDARQRPTLRGLARTEYQEEDSTSARRLRHRSKTNTTSINFLAVLQVGVFPTGTLSTELQFWGTGVHTHAVVGEGGSSGSDVDVVACGWLGSAVPKHVVDAL